MFLKTESGVHTCGCMIRTPACTMDTHARYTLDDVGTVGELGKGFFKSAKGQGHFARSRFDEPGFPLHTEQYF